jgi:hypothetical protein
MKRLNPFTKKIVALTCAWGLGAALAASPDARVYVNTGNTDAVELSNLEDSAATQAPLALEAAPAGPVSASAPQAVTSRAAPVKVSKKTKKKIRLADGTEEEVWVDSEEDADATALAEGRSSDGRNNDTNTTMGFGGGSSSGGYGLMSPGAATSSGTSGTGSAIGAGAASGAGTAASGGGSTGTGSVASVPVPTSALETKLASYRNLMLTEAGGTQIANPALTRRYQMMDRPTYRSRFGL